MNRPHAPPSVLDPIVLGAIPASDGMEPTVGSIGPTHLCVGEKPDSAGDLLRRRAILRELGNVLLRFKLEVLAHRVVGDTGLGRL